MKRLEVSGAVRPL